MTLRAILMGLVGASFVCGVTYFNDAVIKQTSFVGNNLPISVYGLLILFLLIINPLLYIAWKKLAFSGKELTVVLILTLAACSIPGSGLMRTFTTSLVLPFQLEKTSPAWQAPEKPLPWRDTAVLDKLPSHMLVDVNAKNEGEVLDTFVAGKSVGNKHIRITDGVPWYAWTRTLAFWIPLILLLWVGLLGLSIVVHKQWAIHEQLPYPIATFANALLPNAKEAISEVTHNRLFWAGMIVILAIHLNNYACLWFPNIMVAAPQFLNFNSLEALFPTIKQGGGWLVFQPRIYYTVIAFAFFLPADVSLALGLGPMLWATIVGMLAGYGIAAKSGSPSIENSLQFGAYFGMMCVLIYTGRRYYADVFRSAIGLKTQTPADPLSVWGARVFLAGITLVVVYMSTLGHMDWQIAVPYVAITVLIFLVMSRIVAETGTFFVQANFNPTVVLLGLFGAGALGPETILLAMMFTTVLLIDPREAFMPFMVNSLKLAETRSVPIGRTATFAVVALLVGFAVAIPATLYFQYDRGANMSDGWASKIVPGMPFDIAVQSEQRLQAQNQLMASSAVSGWGHFSHIVPDSKMVIALLIGMGLVLLFTVGRLRFSKWPIHPVLFLVWTTYPATWMAGSFGFGWLVKVLVTKYGGGALYRNLKPLMIGMIAGELSAGVLIMLYCAIQFFLYQNGIVTEPPKPYTIFQG